jgi:hypothetical protein
MSYQLFIGLTAEGDTDLRFLKGVVSRTFESIAFDSKQDIEIEVFELSQSESLPKRSGFVDCVLDASAKGFREFGMTVLCIHTDADSRDDEKAFADRIHPAIAELNRRSDDTFCKTAVPLVPVQMTEAWMLADTGLLKQEIGTTLSDVALSINRLPESIANPKKEIEKAIVTARKGMTKRRRHSLTIGELYQPMGQKISLTALETLPSFRKFKANVREAFVQLNLLH